jgi:hypothetical protein
MACFTAPMNRPVGGRMRGCGLAEVADEQIAAELAEPL